MKFFDLDMLNGEAPYKVSWHEASHTFRFKTDYEVVLAISFDEDEMIETADSYVFSVINVNNIPSPRDAKMRDTVMLIIEYFFKVNQAALLYICESGDGRQQIRGRLFEFWFSTYRTKDDYLFMPVTIEDMEGQENLAALIIRKDNPQFVDIVSEFSNTIAMFKVKPELGY